jgi:hypothetical protein
MQRFKIAVFVTLFFASCTPIAQSSVNSSGQPKVLEMRDLTYESQIRSVTLHPLANDPNITLQPAVTQFGEWGLQLEFDDLVSGRDSYYAKIIHCNYDWSKSGLMDLDFITQFNEFNINNYEFSADTHIPYVHYWFQLPPVKIPGNYVVMVYRGGNKEDVVLTKRFIVYDRQVTFQSESNLLGAGAIARRNQQFNFTVNYKNLDIINPLENVKVVIRQNQRWDYLASDVRPNFVRETEKEIEYRFFDESKMFKGGNEFRFFDLRSLNYPGRNVNKVDRTVKPFEVYIQTDKTRKDERYSQYTDINGGFIWDNFDYRDATFSNYCYVNFTLSASIPEPGDIYVTGAFHQWNHDDENLMVYDSTTRQYHARVLLKQGWYDYQYAVESKSLPAYYLEGTHFETENLYEIFVYYRPFQPRADVLIGYQKFIVNQR